MKAIQDHHVTLVIWDLCPSHNLTIWNCYMTLHRWVCLTDTMCCTQVRQVLFLLVRYLPLANISVRAIMPEPYKISSWTFIGEHFLSRHNVTNKNDNSFLVFVWSAFGRNECLGKSSCRNHSSNFTGRFVWSSLCVPNNKPWCAKQERQF